MNCLINAVDNLREETQRRNQDPSYSRRSGGQSTESEMRRLYPSINSSSANTSLGINDSSTPCVPDRSYVQNITNFQPSTNYRPKKGKKNVGQKRKRPPSSTEEGNPSNKEKYGLRDVVLLPFP